MLYVDDIQRYCLAKKLVTEETPFGPQTITYKVGGKIFCFLSIDASPLSIAVKGIPEQLAELREEYEDIYHGAYLSKKHWTAIRLTGTVADKLVLELIDTSYSLVVQGLPKAIRNDLSTR